jgi:GTP-binding protein
VPGLIEGAADGVGLGHEFLAHLERARLLVHVIDASEPDLEGRFETIDRELARYGAGLDERPQLVVLNKLDLVADVPAFAVQDERIVGVIAVSCATGRGIGELEQLLFRLCPAAPEPEPEVAVLPEFLEYRPRPPRSRFRILRTDRGFKVVGAPPEGEELEEALRAAGIRAGAEVEIGGEVLEWE